MSQPQQVDMLMARSGHKVYLVAPDVPLIGPQLPLKPGGMVEELLRAGTDLLPSVGFTAGSPTEEVDLVVAFGASPVNLLSRRVIRLNAEPWAGRIGLEDDVSPWGADLWPFGGMAAAALAAGEAFKIAMRKLQHVAINPDRMIANFADAEELTFILAPPNTLFPRDLGSFDCVSGGAIINAALYALARIPGVTGRGRVIEHDIGGLSNLNRYMLLLRSGLDRPKAEDLADLFGFGSISLKPIPKRYEVETLEVIGPLADTVLVGVDDIPTRWAVQRANPKSLVVGATTHWSAMASFHQVNSGCVQCLHPENDQSTAPIPTVAFVSFWAGLLSATYLIQFLCKQLSAPEQQIYLTAIRPENPFRTPVSKRDGCPTCLLLETSQGKVAA